MLNVAGLQQATCVHALFLIIIIIMHARQSHLNGKSVQVHQVPCSSSAEPDLAEQYRLSAASLSVPPDRCTIITDSAVGSQAAAGLRMACVVIGKHDKTPGEHYPLTRSWQINCIDTGLHAPYRA